MLNSKTIEIIAAVITALATAANTVFVIILVRVTGKYTEITGEILKAAQAQANATLIQASANAQSISNIISQVEAQTGTTWNSTQVAAFTNMYTELQLLSKLTGQNLYIFVGSPNGSLIIPTKP